MKHKHVRALVALVALWIISIHAGFAQDSTQLLNNSHNSTSAAASRPGVSSSPNLGIVPANFSKLRLAPGFMVSLSVLDDPDFVGSFRIDDQGEIDLPILGSLHVAGETVSEAREQIRQRLLKDQILKDPQVNLTVVEYSAPEVTVIGEVTTPGKIPLLVPTKLVDVLAMAGGTTPLAGDRVQITRGSADAEPAMVHYSRGTDPKGVEGIIVNPGDIVRVERAGVVYILGGVTRPGGYVMQENGTLSVLQAISMANGTTLAASVGTVYVLRRNPDGTEIDISVPYNKMAHGKKPDVLLRPTDIVYVPTSKIKSILTYSQGLISSAATAGIYAGAVY